MVGHFQEFEDEYLEMMYEFHEETPGGVVRTGDLASKLGVSPASATEGPVQRLATRGYLEYIPYKGARLTEDGLAHSENEASPSTGRGPSRTAPLRRQSA